MSSNKAVVNLNVLKKEGVYTLIEAIKVVTDEDFNENNNHQLDEEDLKDANTISNVLDDFNEKHSNNWWEKKEKVLEFINEAVSKCYLHPDYFDYDLDITEFTNGDIKIFVAYYNKYN